MIPSREIQLNRLKEEVFDVCVIGGGATGAGVALDAATRGLKTALVEAHDFSSGTSSRSTKLLHGGVRYLEKAFKECDRKQFTVVKEGIKERQILLKIAPHLTRMIPIIIPCYSHFDQFYYGMGMKLYDWMSGEYHSKKVSKEEVIHSFPHIKKEGLKGGILYHDGQFDDARMNISLILTAVQYGAAVANYLEVIQLNKEATVKDNLTGKSFNIRAKTFINAAGPFSDTIRTLDNPRNVPCIKGSRGTHIILDKSICPHPSGLLIPKTADGRVLFVLPWEGSTLVGTTDIATSLTFDPKPTEEEISYLMNHLRHTFDLSTEAIKASWAGIRPLLYQEENTADIPRDFAIVTSGSGLISVMGGKWTSYRKMAELTVDKIKMGCVTEHTLLWGAAGYNHNLLDSFNLEEDIKHHLLHAYGDKAPEVAKLKKNKRLAEGYPYIEAEVIYGIQNEYACTAEDILFRRTRLGTLDEKAAQAAISRLGMAFYLQ